jgi:hypothetical protein
MQSMTIVIDDRIGRLIKHRSNRVARRPRRRLPKGILCPIPYRRWIGNAI